MTVKVKKTSKTKEKVIDAAAYLFNTKGFDGTSVREIARKADVNVANISYYFDNKAGLLEYLVSSFLDGYTSVIEHAYVELDSRSARECLLMFIKNIMNYQKDNNQLARCVLREITLDSVLIREVLTTYMTKEKFYIKSILETGIHQQEFRKLLIPHTIMQLKGMLTMPYLHPQYMTEVLHVMPNETYFTDQYVKELERWVNLTICLPLEKSFISTRTTK
ncbi:forespore capture DNA-binding protein RefZ [Litchfieldia salsa]|uniref:DNA-binding transcriptional regulator, AcrR family n=1 Tax=Litchfieldia salsa TaxID=930152 RepID=A0A1H0P616_9BACI|nr:forespore capture DNA-binding protein RefZ [Litchfieldia salsa]SDP00178.1 DNA-binding transcriptional regulator, AcrR family [Litchfieldia salsa]